ncbi:MAG: hypothetical protein SFU25_06815 [Candidatus Caenarcaniphilales bacterium]|nr:hypothetical protein [Candidatus Caenarcaniphilales bacterium]
MKTVKGEGNGETWSGNIEMDEQNKSTGSIAYKYSEGNLYHHRFGLKRILVVNTDLIYLMALNDGKGFILKGISEELRKNGNDQRINPDIGQAVLVRKGSKYSRNS